MVTVAIKAQVIARMQLTDGTSEKVHLTATEDNTINIMVKAKIKELQSEVQNYLNITRK